MRIDSSAGGYSVVGRSGSLIAVPDDHSSYRITPYGEVTRWFIQDYVPAHPRHYAIADLKPRVAIIRQEDACWGQATSFLPDRLFGSHTWRSSTLTESWLRIWHLLSRGVMSADTMSWFGQSHTGRPYQVFCPLDGVVVYDHHVQAPHLDSVELIFLTGLGLSPETQAAVAQRVRDGAICVGLSDLVPDRVRSEAADKGEVSDGNGRWVITNDFLAPHVRRAVDPYISAYDTLQYRFGDTDVKLHPVDGDPNVLEADVSPA